MTRLQIHEAFAERYARDPVSLRSMLPEGFEPAEYGSGLDSTCLLLTASVSLAGGLGDATPDDLDEYVAHFRGLLSADIVSLEEWDAEGREILDELIDWGSRQTALAELN